MIDIVNRLRFDAVRCETQFSKGVAGNIEEAANEIERLRATVAATAGWREALEDIATLKVTGGAAANRAQAALDTVVSRPDRGTP